MKWEPTLQSKENKKTEFRNQVPVRDQSVKMYRHTADSTCKGPLKCDDKNFPKNIPLEQLLERTLLTVKE